MRRMEFRVSLRAGTSHNPEVFAAHLPGQCSKQIRAAGANGPAFPHQRVGPQFFVYKMGLIVMGYCFPRGRDEVVHGRRQ